MLENSNYFCKIDLVIRNVDTNSLKGPFSHNYGKLSYYFMNDTTFLMDCFRIKPDYAMYVEILGNGHILPHRDHGSKCCLNWYFQSNNSTTFFYKENVNSIAYAYPEKKTANLYSIDSIDCVASFVAKDSEFYLLNTKEIHSVESKMPGYRKFITWQWKKHSYYEIYASMKCI